MKKITLASTLLLSTTFVSSAQAQTFTTPMYDIGFGQTQNFDNIGTSTINFQTVTNTVTVGGVDYTYTTLEKINSGQDWIVTTGGLSDYTRFEALSDITPINMFGGVISNEGTVNVTNVVFGNNINSGSLSRTSGSVVHWLYNYGGAIYNGSTGEVSLNGVNFINNGVVGTGATAGVIPIAHGGAIYNANGAIIGNITGNFIENYATVTTVGNGNAFGGAIYNEGGTIGNVTGNFIGNWTSTNTTGISTTNARGGAIYNNPGGAIGNITGNFINNSSTCTTPSCLASAGAIENHAPIGNITGNFIGNSTSNTNTSPASVGGAHGGAIRNGAVSVGNITGDFVGNYASSTSGYAWGGAISNALGTFSEINGSFVNNYAQTLTLLPHLALGGAIYTRNSLTFKADGNDNFFTGNYTQDATRGKISNAIFLDSVDIKEITFDVINSGNFIIDDMIETVGSVSGTVVDHSVHHNINLTGDGTGKVFIRNDLINIGEISIHDNMLIFAQGPYGKGRFLPDGSLITPMSGNNSVTSLSMNNGQFYIYNNYFETVNLKNYTSAGTSYLHIEVGKDGGIWTSDMLNILGDINGQTHVVVYALTSDTDLTSVVFVDAPNDVIENREAFTVFRTYGSPFLWEAHRNINGNETGSVWYLTMTDEDNEFKDFLPDPITPSDPPELPELPDVGIEVNPEVMAYRGLQIAALEQTRSMVYNVKSKVAANKILPDPCANVIDEYQGRNVWVNPIYFNSTTKRPVEIDANIWGLEAGFDVQRDINHKLGIFVSYRKGDYDLSGKGKQYYSDIKSSIDIDSYIAGLYYRYDYRHLWTFATLYGGIQQADIKTRDGVKADTDGKQFGGSVEVGYTYAIKQDLHIEPSIGASYTQVDFDNIRDTFGKTARYGTISQWEFEAGVKLEQQLNLANGTAKVYVKPSVIQPITGGDNVTITGLGKISTYDDNTLGRVEIGGRYAITNQLSTYGFANYTFGSGYDATSLGIGLNYAW